MEESNSVPGTGANGVTAMKSMRLVWAKISAGRIVEGRFVCCTPCVSTPPYRQLSRIVHSREKLAGRLRASQWKVRGLYIIHKRDAH